MQNVENMNVKSISVIANRSKKNHPDLPSSIFSVKTDRIVKIVGKIFIYSK